MTRMLLSPARGIALSIALGLAVLSSVGAVAFATPSNFVRHENTYWTWYAPKGWVASYSANGIDISSPTGRMWNGYGYAQVPCPSDVGSVFAATRSSLKRQGALFIRPLRRARFTSVGPLRGSGSLIKQKSTYVATRTDGVALRGELDLELIKGGGACSAAAGIRAAPKRGAASSLQLLRAIQNAIFLHPH